MLNSRDLFLTIVRSIALSIAPFSGLSTFDVNAQGTPAVVPKSILFIGNSFTSANAGVDRLVQQLAKSSKPAIELTTTAFTVDGATLKHLWNNQKLSSLLSEQTYDVVVLQSDVPESDVATFQAHARKFVTEVKRLGARPILFMGWSYRRLNWITQAEIARAHYDVAAAMGIDVAPVGSAWLRADRDRPALNLYAEDKEHPNLRGSYLAACVIYATVTKQAPQGPATGQGITDEEAAFLQTVARQAVAAQQ